MLLRIGVLDSNGVSGMVDNDTMLMFLDLLFVEKKKKKTEQDQGFIALGAMNALA